MCGRYVLALSADELAGYFSATPTEDVAERYVPSYNVAPTREVLAVTASGEGARTLDVYRWGLVPSGVSDPSIGNRLFNARAETAAVRPSFRSAFRSRRAVVVADGYFEWKKRPGAASEPYYLHRTDGAPLAFAGLWESWRDRRRGEDAASALRSVTVLTTTPSADLAEIHDRMPVLLDGGALEAWLDPTTDDREELEGLLRSAPLGTLQAYPVDPRVGSVANDDPGLVTPLVD